MYKLVTNFQIYTIKNIKQLKVKSVYIKLLLIVFLFAISACNPTKWLSEGEYLLIKNKIQKDYTTVESVGMITEVPKAGLKFEKRELASFIKQKPNRKILGITRFNLAVYNYTSRRKHRHPKDSLETDLSPSKKRVRKEERLEDKLKKIVGEPPVILDTLMTRRSIRQMELYLNSKGYFNSSVKDSTVYRDKRTSRVLRRGGKAKVYYLINPGLIRYTIRNVNYSIKDPEIYSIVVSKEYSGANSLLQTANYYDEETLSKERDRITKILKNEGYYYFAKENIYFTVDSALGAKQVDITLGIKNLKKQISPDSSIEIKHNRYRINNVYIQTDFSSKRLNISADTILYNDYYFIGKSPSRIKYSIITRKIFIHKDNLFQLNKLENTYKHLAGLQVFKFINIKFNDVSDPDTSVGTGVNKHLLDCIIQLTPTARQSLSIETEGTHSSGNLGIAGNIVYQNKNTFKGAEIFELRLKGALEAQKTLVNPEEELNEPLFNTIEIGTEAKLRIPKFFLPVRAEKIPKRFNPKTTLTMAYNYQKREDEYTRTIAKVSFGYNWKETNNKAHILNPVEINLVKIANVTDAIKQNPNPFIRNSFIDHFTTAFKYTFIFNNQQINKNTNFTYFKTNIELAGNLLWLSNTLLNSTKDSNGGYRIFNEGAPDKDKGIRYAQYARSDIDLRYYKIIDQHNTLVFRTAMGIGIPYGNSEFKDTSGTSSFVLPFEKSFFAGGANGIRAWKARELGPGSLDTITIQLADIKLEGNIEYRFDISKMFQGAAFLDVGNIWLIHELNTEDTIPSGARFEFNKFIDEIAIGAGLGLRLNFTFFIVRLDVAIPLKDPSLLPGNRWFTNTNTKTINFNLGIGYPF